MSRPKLTVNGLEPNDGLNPYKVTITSRLNPNQKIEFDYRGGHAKMVVRELQVLLMNGKWDVQNG